ncbi:MAG TPA: pyridoxamine 5'-phosphate oxidase family protein [Solirubrobacteraceae bacterium]|nr:pyridoxamine 5'-phosphate oxidase family protein [Solirubrobacteraceae bacterium]
MLTRSEFVRFVRAARLAVVATANAQSQPEAALVEVAVTEAGELVFDSKSEARKVRNIALSPRVALVIGWNESVSVQVEGKADILAGADRSAYGQVFESQFPGSRALQEDFALIRVAPDWLRYYDARPDSFSVAEGMWA